MQENVVVWFFGQSAIIGTLFLESPDPHKFRYNNPIRFDEHEKFFGNRAWAAAGSSFIRPVFSTTEMHIVKTFSIQRSKPIFGYPGVIFGRETMLS